MGLIADSDHRKRGDAALDPAHGDAPVTGWVAWIGAGGRSGLGRKARAGGKAVGDLAGSGADWLAAPDSHWRRRFFILAWGLAFLGLITWCVSAQLGPARPIGGTPPAQAATSAGKAVPRPAPAASEAARVGLAAPAATPSAPAPPGATLPDAAYGPPVTPPSASPTFASPASAPGASASAAPAGGAAPVGGQCQPGGRRGAKPPWEAQSSSAA